MESPIFSAILLLALLSRGIADPAEDKQALLDFLGGIRLRRRLNWDSNGPVCGRWTGVICSSDKSRIVTVRLPGVGFNGRIPPNTLSRLSALQTLSLRSNGLTGPFPSDFANLTSLANLYLQFNRFTGPLPSDLSVWTNLTVLDLSFNAFNESIPSSLSNLTHLSALNLSNNSFSGKVPDFGHPNLQLLNLSNNNLVGEIPNSLRRFPNSSFRGNSLVNSSFFDIPISPSPPPPPPSLPPILSPVQSLTKTHHRLSEAALLGIIVGGCALVFAVIAVFLLLCCSRGNARKPLKKLGSSPEKPSVGKLEENNRLVFFDGCNFVFDLEDLLRASAEVLGKGTFGTAYKAVLEDGATVVVKRLKEVGVGRREFEQQMEVVGRVRHENVVELRAYYYSKDEKLIVCDYYRLGSVSSMLHGRRGENKTPVDWETRVRVAIGAARGVARIHAESSGRFVHGNIKSSNIFLNPAGYGCVSDLGPATIIHQSLPPMSRPAGYRAPEVFDTRKATQASDVYSFGVVLLELLTGKSPVQVIGGRGDEVVHLVRWVRSVVREEWTAEVFDLVLMRYPNIEEEMVEMLQIALACVTRAPGQRPRMEEVVRMVEDIRRGGADSCNRTSSDAESVGVGPTPVQGVSCSQHLEGSSPSQC
ncbi:putative inactive receptor kinase [Acorus gramineus]|uniref:Inactive receptor kinase n=1 Tax=Acorus gramineus TaxID=55184 RepID=A0AAV9AX77_ACOGR|nr:putative inactive receptor kinase [Acorus gramineus]